MKDFIKKKAVEIGFGAVGVTTAEPVDAQAYIKDAIDGGRIAEMKWLARDPRARCDPASLLPGAKSVICCALCYGVGGLSPREDSGDMRSARFARGSEYHEAVRAKLEALWNFIRERELDARAKLCVDTSPILEKALAQRAGLGWIGKHTVLLNEELGSWFVLGEIITDIEIEPDRPARDMCGECRSCIGSCPTGALIAERVLDARRCLSYLTIEAPHLGSPSHGCSYGCDICQEACPYNLG